MHETRAPAAKDSCAASRNASMCTGDEAAAPAVKSAGVPHVIAFSCRWRWRRRWRRRDAAGGDEAKARGRGDDGDDDDDGGGEGSPLASSSSRGGTGNVQRPVVRTGGWESRTVMLRHVSASVSPSRPIRHHPMCSAGYSIRARRKATLRAPPVLSPSRAVPLAGGGISNSTHAVPLSLFIIRNVGPRRMMPPQEEHAPAGGAIAVKAPTCTPSSSKVSIARAPSTPGRAGDR